MSDIMFLKTVTYCILKTIRQVGSKLDLRESKVGNSRDDTKTIKNELGKPEMECMHSHSPHGSRSFESYLAQRRR